MRHLLPVAIASMFGISASDFATYRTLINSSISSGKGSRGVGMRAKNRKMAVKRHRANKVARHSRKVNGRKA